ncbi:hypothetical protein LCGC14_1369730 [marine sediment metagenome]|uniref:Uncharacterized protein n=1 Tax=marine sediment metagenome TaxID=412755 RepID=A0A0F9K645_9ZZZZ
MNRREFLAIAAAAPLTYNSRYFYDGWLPSGNIYVQRTFGQAAKHLTNFGQNKLACLWKTFEHVTEESWTPRKQLGADCVAMAAGAALDILTTVQMTLKQTKERWVAETNTDMIYSGGRNLIPKSKPQNGMRAEWVVKYLNKYGNLLKQQYGEYDLRSYTKALTIKWDHKGVPAELLEIAKEHPLLEYAQVKSWIEFRDAIAAGYPVLFCASMGGSNSRRDSDGFIKPSKRKWYHSWCGAGIVDGKRPGALLINSHGEHYGSGPKTHGQPDGSVWIDAKHIDSHCRKFGDSYALSLYKGFPKPEEEYILW